MIVGTWNIGLAAIKEGFLPDRERIAKVLNFIKRYDVQLVALQEMATRTYEDQSRFSSEEFIRHNDPNLSTIHFEPALSLCRFNSNPYGKFADLQKRLGITLHEQGPGIWIRQPFQLQNIYSAETEHQALACVEVTRPLPQPLYLVDGRDDEDRPSLWARINCGKRTDGKKVYFISIHLPTLKNERSGKPVQYLSDRQKEILETTLRLPPAGRAGSISNADQLGSQLRSYYLEHIISQTQRLEAYWQHDCVFILACDFNFDHNKPTNEEVILRSGGFIPAKTRGFTRPDRVRLIDNIWVKGAEIQEWLVPEEGCPIEESRMADDLLRISDHFPVVCEICQSD